MNLRSQRSQSTTEFIIVLVVILAAVIVGARDFLKPAIIQVMNNIGEGIKRSTNTLRGI